MASSLPTDIGISHRFPHISSPESRSSPASDRRGRPSTGLPCLLSRFRGTRDVRVRETIFRVFRVRRGRGFREENICVCSRKFIPVAFVIEISSAMFVYTRYRMQRVRETAFAVSKRTRFVCRSFLRVRRQCFDMFDPNVRAYRGNRMVFR